MNDSFMYEYLLTHLKQSFPGALWPAPVSADASALLALQYQLDKSQYAAPDFMQRQQFKKAGLMLRHAYETVPFYSKRVPRTLANELVQLHEGHETRKKRHKQGRQGFDIKQSRTDETCARKADRKDRRRQKGR